MDHYAGLPTLSASLPDVLFLGDPHGSYTHAVNEVLRRKPDALVLLGDLCPRQPLSQELSRVLDGGIAVLWIPGNHDADTAAIHDNVFLDSGHENLICIHRGVHTVIGRNGGRLTIAGLGGVFRQKVWLPSDTLTDEPLSPTQMESGYLRFAGKGNVWRGGLPLKHRTTIFRDHWEALARERADILVTHEAPHFHRYGNQWLHALAVRMGARYSFHGHHHENRIYGEHGGIRAYGVAAGALMNLAGRCVYSAA